MKECKEEDIVKRLDILISLSLKQQEEVPVTKKNMRDVVSMLYRMGLDDYKTIAQIIGSKNPISVANILTKLKVTKRGKKNGKEAI